MAPESVSVPEPDLVSEVIGVSMGSAIARLPEPVSVSA